MIDRKTATFYAYSNGTDTIIGASLDEAIAAYREENQDAEYPENVADEFKQLADDKILKIRDYDGNGNTKSMTVREWIDDQITSPPDGLFSRLLCSTEY